MTRIELAPGLTVSRIISGLWQIADRERGGTPVNLDEAAEAMLPFVEAGLTTFDTADHYGSSEEILGRFRARYPSLPIETFTKWVPRPGRITREDVRAAVTRALGRLNTPRIDLLQFHAWSYPDPSWLDALGYLGELVDEGLIARLGVTNFDTAHLEVAVASGIPLITNQVSFSLLDRRAAHGMSELCQRTGVKLLAFGTLAGGFLSDRWLGRPEPALDDSMTWSQMKYKRFIDAAGGWARVQALLGVLHQLAGAKGTSIAAIASRFMLDHPAVGSVIVGTRLGAGTAEAARANLQALGLELSPADREAIAAAVAELDAIPGDCGDEYRRPPFLTASGDLSHHVSEFPPPYPVHEDGRGGQRAVSGTVWEGLAGYSRAVRVGERIFISGTTATHGSRVVGGSSPSAQTHFIIDKLEGALLSLGARLEDVVRTRIYVRDIAQWEPVARAHGVRFRGIQPANTMVRAELIGEAYLVEIEAEAVVRLAGASR